MHMELENLTEEDLEVQFIHYQSKLFPFAYNVVGDTMEAEDIVQETLNKYFLEQYSFFVLLKFRASQRFVLYFKHTIFLIRFNLRQ